MLELVLVIVGIGLLIVVGGLTAVAKFYRKVDQGQALIVNKMQKMLLIETTNIITI